MAEQPEDGRDWREIPEGVMPTDAQWLQRLLDSPREKQLWYVHNVRAAAAAGQDCVQYQHQDVIRILRSHSIEKTHTIRRLEAHLSQDRPRQDPSPPAE